MRTVIKLAIVGIAGTAALLTGAGAATAASNTTAVPAGTAGFAPAGCTAQFVRSASGIINETSRTGCPVPDGVTAGTAIWLQFRPTVGKVPNPTCDSDVVRAPFVFSTTEASLSKWFDPTQRYNVCFYLVNNSSVGTINSAVMGGSDVALPVANGTYRIDVVGAWTNGTTSGEDAEYSTVDNWATYFQGYDIAPYFLGEGFGDTQVNGGFVDWGSYSATHSYSNTQSHLSTSLNLAVFDGDSNTNTKNPGWYGDNSGLLSFTVTYLGLS